MKECRCCKETKSFDLLVKNKAFKDGFDTICRDCSRERVKQWRKDNPEKRRAQQRLETKRGGRKKHLKRSYGLSLEEYNQMFEDQHGSCKICGVHQSQLAKPLFVDHCHTTGAVRGLLCTHCNFVLGYARDNPVILQSAINYLTVTGY